MKANHKVIKNIMKILGFQIAAIGTGSLLTYGNIITLIITYIFIIIFVILIYFLATSKRFKDFLKTINRYFFTN